MINIRAKRHFSTWLRAAQNGFESMYSRPTGVYLLDPDPATGHRPNDAFLTGEMHRISWNQIEQAQGTYLWADNLDDIFTQLPFGQDASLNLIEEPCYIATHPNALTWCDTSQGSPTPAPRCIPTP